MNESGTEPAARVARELRELAAGLRAELERARRRGRTRLREPPPAAAAPPGESRAAREPVPAPAPPPPRVAVAAAVPPSAEAPAGGADVHELAAACADLEALRRCVAECRACELCRARTQTVFGDGDGSAGVMFVGEAPGAEEDAQGVPFVGRAGKLLTDIIVKGMRLDRRRVYIANVLKCRPPGNRDPRPEEKRLCTPWLHRQLELVAPRVIVPLGRHAAGHLLSSDASMGRMRGVHRVGGRVIVPTFHPAYLLRSPEMKKECWKDIQLAMAELGLSPPAGE